MALLQNLGLPSIFSGIPDKIKMFTAGTLALWLCAMQS